MNPSNIKVLIIDDSALMRNLVSKALSFSDKIEVAGTAINGRFGINKLDKLKPDVIILDLEMPEMNGIEFLKKREELGVRTPVIILSAHAKEGAKITLEALALGASDFILKPSGSFTRIEDMRDKLIEMVLALGKPDSFVQSDINKPTPIKQLQPFAITKRPETNIEKYLQPVSNVPQIDIVVIGISTGGPNALRKILPQFPEDFPVPIVIVQHMPPGFTFEFAKSLNKICPLEVKEAADMDIVRPGRILISPGGYHVTFGRKSLATVIELNSNPVVNGHRPSADVLFESAAKVYGTNVCACIMTGMGKDGAYKIGNILRNGGITIAQDEESSIVFGMPRVAIMEGNIQAVASLDEIAPLVKNVVLRNKISSS
jgi:two-component system chemotaxis response regulator CheB